MYDVEIYEDEYGRSEIKNWLDQLNNSSQVDDKRVLKKVRYQLKLLQALGPGIRPPQSKVLKGYKYPIMELRPLPDRIFFLCELRCK